MQDKIFYIGCFGFLFGVLCRSFVFVNLYLNFLFGIIAAALLLFFILISKNKWGILISILVISFCLGVLRFHIFSAQGGPAPGWESQVGQKVNLSGEIIDEPSINETSQKLTVEIQVQKSSTKILLSTGLDVDYKYGDQINFTGVLKKPENFLTDQGVVFDYVNYLRKDGIFYVMSYPKIEIVSGGNGNPIKSALFYAKEKFSDKINFLIPSPESIFMGGLIFGEKSDFNQTLKQSFVDTGMIHLVTLSGYKITMIASWFIKVLAFLPKSLGIGMGILLVWLFVLMTGGAATAVRAGIMATLALIARAISRNYDVARALVLTGIIMVLLNPFVLVYDVSFQLSFIGTAAIIFYVPKIEKYFLWITSRFGLRDIVTMTCAIYIFVFPFILYKMGNFSSVTLPANVLIMPLFPLTIIFGFLTVFAGLVSNILAILFAYASYFLLHYELWVISFFSNLPFAAFSIPNFPLWLTIIIYAYFIHRLFGRNIKSFFTEPS